MDPSKYYKKIDGLRFIAIFFVLVQHYPPYVGNYFTSGYYGVDLFFVISGFLITSILIKENPYSFLTNYKNFIGRRVLRIFPIYYLSILLLVIFDYPEIKIYLLSILTYTFNYNKALLDLKSIHVPITHFWSLCVEEQFYLIWPFIIISLKNHLKVLLGVILAIILFGYLQLYVGILPGLKPFYYFDTFTRMSALGLGALCSVLLYCKLLPNKFFQNKYLEIIILGIWIFTLYFQFKKFEIILALTSSYFVLKSAYYNFRLKYINSFLENKIIIKLGILAYGIYLYHPFVSQYTESLFFTPIWNKIPFERFGKFKILQWHPWILKFPIYSLITYIIALYSFKWIEDPFLKLKKKYFN